MEIVKFWHHLKNFFHEFDGTEHTLRTLEATRLQERTDALVRRTQGVGKMVSCWVVDAERLWTSTNSRLVSLTLKVGGWWSGLILMAIVASSFLIIQASRVNMWAKMSCGLCHGLKGKVWDLNKGNLCWCNQCLEVIRFIHTYSHH